MAFIYRNPEWNRHFDIEYRVTLQDGTDYPIRLRGIIRAGHRLESIRTHWWLVQDNDSDNDQIREFKLAGSAADYEWHKLEGAFFKVYAPKHWLQVDIHIGVDWNKTEQELRLHVELVESSHRFLEDGNLIS